MNILFILTEIIILAYGTRLSPLTEHLDNVRFFFFALIIFCGLFYLREARRRGLKLIDIVGAGVLTQAFISYFYSLDPQLTLMRSSINLLMYLAVFWAFWMACRTSGEAHQWIRNLITIWFVFYVLNFAYLFIHPQDAFFLLHREFGSGGHQRFAGITANPNQIGDFSAMILPLVIWNLYRKKNFLNLAFLGMVIYSFFFSFSRNAFICGVISTTFFLFVIARNHRPLLVVMALFAIGLMILYVDLFGSFLPEALVRRESLDVLGGRTEAWQAAIELIKKHPLKGYGFGVEDLLFQYYGYRFKVHAGAYAHNSFLGLSLQLGLVTAISLYFSFTIFLIRNFFKIVKTKGEFKPLVAALYACVLGGFITTFFESWLYSPGAGIGFNFYLCLMLLMRMLSFYSQEMAKLKAANAG